MNTWYVYIFLLTLQVVAVTIFVEGIITDKLREKQEEVKRLVEEECEECIKSSD